MSLASRVVRKQESRPIRAIVFPQKKASKPEADNPPPGESSQNPVDDLLRSGRVIDPPFDPLFLISLLEMNSEVGDVIEAMETNVVGYGWRLEPTQRIAMLLAETKAGAIDAPDIAKLRESVEVEWETYDEFLNYGNYGEGSLTRTRRQQRKDLETTGMSFLELVQDSRSNTVGYIHAPSYRMRLTIEDEESTTYTETRVVGRGDRRRLVTAKKRRRFRRYVQLSRTSWDRQIVYFKEFDDPRPISRETGEVLEGADAENPAKRANPILYRRLYCPRSPYGMPRFIGNLLAILGGRAAEEINFTTFRNNQIPSMWIMASGGHLTDETITRISEFAENNLQSDDNRSRFVILEAESGEDFIQAPGQAVKIDVKPMTEHQIKDAMFVEYEKNNFGKIRRAWRMPSLLVGDVEGYTKSAAETSRLFTEEQVFEPERREDDWDWNRILHTMGMIHHEFKTNSPNVTNDENLIQVMGAAEKSGAMTPRLARQILSEILNREVPGPDESKVPLDVPFSATMAEMVKNLAQPNEPGQQVTAIKGEEVTVRKALDVFATWKKRVQKGDVLALVVDTETASHILNGTKTEIVVKAKNLSTTSEVVALCDETEILGWVGLDGGSETAGEWVYEVQSAVGCDPHAHNETVFAGGFANIGSVQ